MGEDLSATVYEELHRLAAAKLAHESPHHTLNPTALVHEAYLRLAGQNWDNRGHFYAAAAQAMRRVLIDHARGRVAAKRDGGRRNALDPDHLPSPQTDPFDLLALDDALTRFAAVDAKAAELVSLRYFAGLTLPEAAEALGVSPRSADRMWAFAKAWLFRELSGKSWRDSAADSA